MRWLVSRPRFERGTLALKGRCSAIELAAHRRIILVGAEDAVKCGQRGKGEEETKCEKRKAAHQKQRGQSQRVEDEPIGKPAWVWRALPGDPSSQSAFNLASPREW